ncbi:helix-turn-helix domain-containing protein [Gayadomonas joobiniege]|uniref:helix-turn-helix domain-containing protein n=1 Tax=Gayadomonas joobiniege TaxID=1234606 RepID=UPI000362DC44|nr:helix-turn-helix domain-containing protein [Gayadomonas joobiniege]
MNKQMNAPELDIQDHFDANIQANNMGEWQQKYDQISEGAFYGSIKHLSLPKIKLFAEQSSRALKQQCSAGEAGLWLGFSDSADFKINGRTGKRDQMYYCSGLADFELVTPEHFSIYSLVMPTQVVESLLQTQQTDLHSLQLAKAAPTTVAQVKYYVEHLMSGNFLPASCDDLLLDSIADILQADQIENQEGLNSSQRYRVVKRVNEYLNDEKLKKPVTVGALIEVAFVSRRTLQYCMQSCLGLSPKQYISLLRLNQIRRRFLDPDESKNISELAFEHGYFHLGQFGQDYKRLFGETPGQTIARYRPH